MDNTEALSNMLKVMDFDAEDLIRVVSALSEIKKKKDEKKEEEGNKFSMDKTFILGKDDCWIYRDNRTKAKWWYIKIYESRFRKTWSKSLKTTNKTVAIALAEEMYADRRGRLSVGARPVSITSRELVKMYENHRRKDLTTIQQMGITQKSFDRLCGQIQHWVNYTKLCGHFNTKIENIPRELGVQFAHYIQNLKKTNDFRKPRRCNQTTNHTVAAVKKMYKFANDLNYVTASEIPNFKYLKVGRDNSHKRDVLTKEEKEKITRWIQYKYCNEKGITKKEQIKRRCFAQYWTIAHLMGTRPIEVIKMKWCDISINQKDDAFGKKFNRVIHIPAESSKTGRPREIVSPIADNLKTLKKWYKQKPFELDPKPEHYIFPKMTLTDIKNNVPTSKVAIEKRWKAVIKKSEEDGVWDSQGRRITLYSSRHWHISDAIMRDVPIWDIAQNTGTSEKYISSTYAHISTRMRSEVLTKNQGAHNMKEETKKKILAASK